MTENTIDLQMPTWTKLSAPTSQTPYWHDVEDRAVHDLRLVLAAAPTELVEAIESMHAGAIRAIVSEAITAQRAGDSATARRLSNAAGRLCQQIIGLWPVSAATAA